MDNRFEVTVSAGTMMSGSADAVGFPHRWTPGGVTVEADFTGGHLLHLAAGQLANCLDQTGVPHRGKLIQVLAVARLPLSLLL